MDSVGGGVVAEFFFSGIHIIQWGGVVAEIFRDPYYVDGRHFSINGRSRP